MLAGAAVVALAATAMLTRHVLGESRIDQMFRDRAVMEQLGPLGYHGYDAWTYAATSWFRKPASADEIAGVRQWFADRVALRGQPVLARLPRDHGDGEDAGPLDADPDPSAAAALDRHQPSQVVARAAQAIASSDGAWK